MGTITHTHQTAIANDPSKDVSANVWNAGHTFSLTPADVGLTGVRVPLSNALTVNVPSQFATLQDALAFAATIDFVGLRLTIQLASGTYTGPFVIPVTVGQRVVSSFILQGDLTTPSNVVLTAFNPFGGIVEAGAATRLLIQGVQFAGSSGFEHGIHANNGAVVEFQTCDFGGGMYFQRFSETGGSISSDSSYSISGSAQSHVGASAGYSYDAPITTVTLTGTPNFATCFCISSDAAKVRFDSPTFSGGATGVRYIAQNAAGIGVNGMGINYLPGDAPGTSTTGFYG